MEGLRSALRFYQDRTLVLIDTPGHNPKDTEVLDQLRHFLEELPKVETHLVLSATTKPKDLADIALRFEPLKPSRLIFTKLDTRPDSGVESGRSSGTDFSAHTIPEVDTSTKVIGRSEPGLLTASATLFRRPP